MLIVRDPYHDVTLGDGNDQVTLGASFNDVSLGKGNDTVVLGGKGTVTAGDGNDVVTVGDGYHSIALGNGNDSVTVGNGYNRISVGDGNDQISVGDGTNTINLGNGLDAVTLGNGSNTVNLGGGTDTIVVSAMAGDTTNAAQDDVVANSGATQSEGELLFAAARSDQLWFQRTNDDLIVSVIGTGTQVDIANWYDGATNHLSAIQASNGKLLTDGQVDALVSAMASFNPPSAGTVTLADDYQQQLQPVITSNWH